ncbi:hypothetical protein KC327_g24 [Hortaea werneckii]|nr:hypothetical protein KC327_g24 [Hortaea werneckii]
MRFVPPESTAGEILWVARHIVGGNPSWRRGGNPLVVMNGGKFQPGGKDGHECALYPCALKNVRQNSTIYKNCRAMLISVPYAAWTSESVIALADGAKVAEANNANNALRARDAIVVKTKTGLMCLSPSPYDPCGAEGSISGAWNSSTDSPPMQPNPKDVCWSRYVVVVIFRHLDDSSGLDQQWRSMQSTEIHQVSINDWPPVIEYGNRFVYCP